MSNNLDAPVLNVKLIKWSLNRINYYYKTLYTNLHYFNVSVGQCERNYQIKLNIENIINSLWTPWQ